MARRTMGVPKDPPMTWASMSPAVVTIVADAWRWVVVVGTVLVGLWILVLQPDGSLNRSRERCFDNNDACTTRDVKALHGSIA